MNIDIRGIWRYKAARETCEGLRDAITAQAAAREAAIAAKDAVIEQKDREAELAEAKISQLRKERDDAQKIIDTATERFFSEKEKLKKEHAEEVNRLETEAEEQHRSYESLEEYCKILEDDAKKLKEKIKDLEAENKKLKKIRWRWLDAEHGWWPVEGADVDEMVKKVPYVPYAPKPKEKQVPET